MFKSIVTSKIFSVIMAAVLGFGAGLALGGPQAQVSNTAAPIREANVEYKFIHPLLGISLPEASEQEYEDLKDKINQLIEETKSERSIATASVYLRNLTEYRKVSVNESEKYEPASLIKVVIMMAYFKKAEVNPDLLKESLTYVNKELLAFETPSHLAAGHRYTIEELITFLIIDSDNGAKNLLLEHIDDQTLNSVYTALNIKPPGESEAFTLSTREYSLFLRVLYDSTFLNRTYSEKALSLLSQVKFKEGLAAGLPSDTIVAHKFGERMIARPDQTQYGELHDCGIIYLQNYNYLLCIMTRGQDKQKLVDTIREISTLVYTEITKLPN